MLLDGLEPKQETKDDGGDVKFKISMKAFESPSPQPKKRKRSAPKKALKGESDGSELDSNNGAKYEPNSEEESGYVAKYELDSEEKGKPKMKPREPKPKRIARPPDSDQEEDNVKSESSGLKRKPKEEGETEEEIVVKKMETSASDAGDSDGKAGRVVKKRRPSDLDVKLPIGEEAKAAVDDEEEYSDVIDEPPAPKRKSKDRKEASRGSGSKKGTTNKTSTRDDDEIKKLQGQLVKCGVRKLWHNELKRYGDDARAKIRHLRKMLADAGMTGRFSEARAREIKEAKELLAEAEAAQEMNALWGMGRGGRASRSKGRVKTEPSTKLEEGSDDDVKDEDDEEDRSFAARRRRAQADLAFLGDDTESD